MHTLISPRKKKADEKKNKLDERQSEEEANNKKKEDEDLRIPWSPIPKSRRLDKLQAKVAMYPVLIGEDEKLIPHVRFKDKQYAQAIITYVKKNYPDFLLTELSHLLTLTKQYETLVHHRLLDKKRHVQAVLEYIKESPDFQRGIISDLRDLVRHDKNYAKAIKRYTKETHPYYFRQATDHLNEPSEAIGALLQTPDEKDKQFANAIIEYGRSTPDFQEAVIQNLHNRINRIEWYRETILGYVKSRHPGYFQEVTYDPPALDEDIVNHPQIVIIWVSYILGLIGYTNWPTVQQHVQQWARSDRTSIRAMAGTVLGAAHRDSELEQVVDYILAKYVHSKNEKLLWTAAKTYEIMGLVDFERSLNGLAQIVCCLDLSSWEFVEQFISHLNEYAEERWRDYFLDQANISILDSESAATAQHNAYIQKYLRAFEDYDKKITVYNAVRNTMWDLARYISLKEVINILSDWANDTDEKDVHTAQLTASSIALDLAERFTELAEVEKAPNRILELISHDEEALDALADLLSSSLIRLYRIKLAKKHKSMNICLVLERWAESDQYTDTLTDLLCRIQTYLQSDPYVLRYFNLLFERRWRSKKMSKNIQSIADIMLQKQREL
jgi:hypothetical protein